MHETFRSVFMPLHLCQLSNGHCREFYCILTNADVKVGRLTHRYEVQVTVRMIVSNMLEGKTLSSKTYVRSSSLAWLMTGYP